MKITKRLYCALSRFHAPPHAPHLHPCRRRSSRGRKSVVTGEIPAYNCRILFKGFSGCFWRLIPVFYIDSRS